MLSRSKQLPFQGKTYSVSFPNNRQFIEIQTMKLALSSQYEGLQFSGVEGGYAQTLIDAISHLRVLCPELEKDLNKNILDLTMEEGLLLVELYNKEFRPWYDELMAFVFKINKTEQK